MNGRAAVVIPDNVLFEGEAGETIRRKLLNSAKGADARHQTAIAHSPFGGRCAQVIKELAIPSGGVLNTAGPTNGC